MSGIDSLSRAGARLRSAHPRGLVRSAAWLATTATSVPPAPSYPSDIPAPLFSHCPRTVACLPHEGTPEGRCGG